VLPDKIISIGSSTFTSCYLLEKIKIPSSVKTIQAQAFATCYALIEYDFTDHTSVPTLANTNVFSYINGICKIKVPANLYYEWIETTNWSTYADYIVTDLKLIDSMTAEQVEKTTVLNIENKKIEEIEEE
jgi:hypothetical protein